MDRIIYQQLHAGSTAAQKQVFRKLVLLYGAELDSHQNRTTPKETLEKWSDSMRDGQEDKDRPLALCSNGNSCSGCLYGKTDRPEHRGYIKAGYGCIMEFYVLPPYRRKGYGRQMYAHLEEWLKKGGAKRLYLTSDPVTGKPFWESLGFTATGEKSPENDLEIYEKGVSAI